MSTDHSTARVIYMMGPSGSGKDAIISELRRRLHPNCGLIIAHRYITRHWSSGGENHIELTDSEYDLRHSVGLFALSWDANGNRYALGHEVNSWLRSNHSVLVNGSREHLARACSYFGERLLPILVRVDEDQLRQRLLKRNRESAAEVEARIERSRNYQAAMTRPFHSIDNNDSVAKAVDQLEALAAQLTTYVPRDTFPQPIDPAGQ